MNKSSCVKTIPEWKWKCRFTIKTQNNNAFYEQKCYNSGFDASKKKKKIHFLATKKSVSQTRRYFGTGSKHRKKDGLS